MVSILCNIESLDTKNIPTSRMNSNSSVNYGMEYQTTFDFFDFYRTLVSILSCGLKAILYCFIHPHKYSSSSIFYLCTLILLKGVMSEDLDPILYPPPILLGPQSIFQCNEVNQCQSAKMTCTENEHCYVNCTATFACQFASINAPLSGDLTVYCSGWKACDITTITSTGAVNGNLNVECASGGAVSVCENVNIYCPFNGICDVRFGVLGKSVFVDASLMMKGSLLVHGTGQYGTIKCPGNNNECIIECNAYECKDSTFQTQVDTAKLQITASGAESLKNSKVYCPSGDGECSINTYGDGPELLSHFELYSINGFEDISFGCDYSTEMSPNCFDISNPPKLYCTSDYSKKCNIALESGIENWQCREIDTSVLYTENIANGYYGNTLICNQVEECQNQTLYCNDNEDCNVDCEGDYACHLATIYAPTTGNLTVYCSGTRACDTATIYGATNGTLQVECASGDATCENLDIYCPDNGLCELGCGVHVSDKSNHCKAIFIDARSMCTGSLLIHGTGQCAVVQCPGNNNECIIECGAYGCRDSTIKAQAITSKLNITAFGINSLKNSYIYCPSGTVRQSPGECLIHTYGAGPDILSGTNIYAINGLADLSLLCDYSTDTANCYDSETPPHLYCTPGYDVTCDIMLESGFNQWQCLNTLNSTKDVCKWTYDPETYPNIPVTVNPTCIPTSVPTKYPTNPPKKNPTITPIFFTNTPTKYPTIAPKKMPTVTPTFTSAPTKNPTGNPSSNPTSFPTTMQPTKYLTSVTNYPTVGPTNAPNEPTSQPSIAPTTTQTSDPTAYPTQPPTFCYNAKYSPCMFEARNDDLWSDEVLASINCKYILKMNKNGNLILYGKYNEYDFVAKWMTNTTIFGRTGVSIPHFVIENGQLRIVEYPHKNKPGVNSIELWKSNNKSSHAVQTNNVLTTKKVTNVLTLTNYGCLIFAEGKNSKNFIWRLCVDGATTPSSTNVVNMDESEQSADFPQNMNSDWADLWWVWLLIVFVIAISLLICFGLYEYKKHQNEKWVTSPACSSVSTVSSPRSPSCASNFEVNDNQHMHCDSGFKETDKQIEQWAQETCYNGGRNVDIDGVEIMYSNDGTEDGPADQMQTKK